MGKGADGQTEQAELTTTVGGHETGAPPEEITKAESELNRGLSEVRALIDRLRAKKNTGS